MGLDLKIKRKRVGKAYEGLAPEEVFYGRNCWKVREIIIPCVDIEDQVTVKISIGVIHEMLNRLADYVKDINWNDKEAINDNTWKVFDAISQLSKICYEDIGDYNNLEIEYEYILIDSY